MGQPQQLHKRTSSILLFAMALVMLLSGGCWGQTGHSTLTTDTQSSQLPTEAEKLAFLQRYLKLVTPVQAVDFHIVYHDNSAGFAPGPSDWDIRVLLKVAPADATMWIAGMQPAPTDLIDLAWAKSFGAQHSAWAVTSEPEVYQKAGMRIGIFRTENIIFVHAATQF